MEVGRRKFQGVLNILSFNRHFYVIGIVVLAALVLISILAELPTIVFWLIIISFMYGLIMPLIVSAYVYD
ncbi:MAG TPA: methyltransferase type 11, partial [Cyclobacteriaceae bacterium]|nr:methyltransferase type 11 [Cyclobacteriaceae bacterium]